MTKSPKKQPKENLNLETFSPAFTDIAIRDAQDTMAIPCLSLSKTPRFEPIRYQKDNVELIVTGGEPYGIATIWDWDLILWLLSQIRQGLDEGLSVSRKIRFHPYAYLRAIGRSTGGDNYKSFRDSVLRLANTNIFTTIRTKTKRISKFTWIEYCNLAIYLSDPPKKELKPDPKDPYVIAQLPEWLFEAVLDSKLVLTISQDYFDLAGGIERWLYRFIRKQAGDNAKGWRWKLSTLYERSGSVREYKYFVRDLKTYVLGENRENPRDFSMLIDYKLTLEREGEMEYLHAIRCPNQDTLEQISPATITNENDVMFLHFQTSTYEEAQKILAGTGLDAYVLEQSWRESSYAKEMDFQDHNQAFLEWCRTMAKQKKEENKPSF